MHASAGVEGRSGGEECGEGGRGGGEEALRMNGPSLKGILRRGLLGLKASLGASRGLAVFRRQVWNPRHPTAPTPRNQAAANLAGRVQ